MHQQHKDRIGADAVADNPLPSHTNSDHLNAEQKTNAGHNQCRNEKCLCRNEISGVLHVPHLTEQDKLQQNATGDGIPRKRLVEYEWRA